MRALILFALTALLLCSCRGSSREQPTDASPPTRTADASSDAKAPPAAPPAPSWPYTHIPPPPPDYGLDAVDKAIETSGFALRQELVSRFHEDSARANGVSVSHHRATVAITGFEHIRGVDKVWVYLKWAFYSSWVLVEGHTDTGLDASMLVTRRGRTVIDPSSAHFDPEWLPVLSAHLRVHSVQDAKRRMRSFHYLEQVGSVCDRNYQMIRENGTILDLRSGCSYIRYLESPPPPEDFAMFPCGPDGLPVSRDGGSDAKSESDDEK